MIRNNVLLRKARYTTCVDSVDTCAVSAVIHCANSKGLIAIASHVREACVSACVIGSIQYCICGNGLQDVQVGNKL